MTRKRNPWTKEEDEVLVQAVKDSPHNKEAAFKIAATKVNHSAKVCSNRWYTVLSNPESKHYVGSIFSMIGYASEMCNRSVFREGTNAAPVSIKEGIWDKIKKLLHI